MSLSSLQRTVEMVWPQRHSSTFQAVALEKLRWFCLWKVAQGRMTVIASEIWTHLVCKRIWLPDQRSSFLEKYTSLLLFSSLILNYSSNTASTYFLSKYVFNLLINNTSLLKMRFPFFFFFFVTRWWVLHGSSSFCGAQEGYGASKTSPYRPQTEEQLLLDFQLSACWWESGETSSVPGKQKNCSCLGAEQRKRWKVENWKSRDISGGWNNQQCKYNTIYKPNTIIDSLISESLSVPPTVL